MSRGAPGTFTRVVLSRPILFISLIVFLWLLWHIRDSPSIRDRISTTVPSRPWRPSTNHADTKPACRSLPGAADVVAVMRTGATELADKLPVHFSTTLKCFHDYLIFSDYEEYLDGEHILDALESVSPEIKATHPDFELWRRLRADGGRAGLRADELSGPDNRPHGGLGKDENPGWKLDKWKFLPMVNRTLAEFPDKKWYLFLEADTFVFARSLFAQLAALDWTKPYYVGSEMQIGDVLFAHGGSGFIVSRPALQAVVRLFVSQQEEWERFTDGHWAGDCVLGKAFLDSGTPVVWANPIWQGMPVGQVPWEKEGLLCRPAVSYHHVSPSVVEDMWRFEQQLAVNHRLNVIPSTFLRHIDVLTEYILPRTRKVRSEWDNQSSDDQGGVESLDTCRDICEQTESCVQYAIKDARCMTTSSPSLGHEAPGVVSGWIQGRMERFVEEAPKCSGNGWIT